VLPPLRRRPARRPACSSLPSEPAGQTVERDDLVSMQKQDGENWQVRRDKRWMREITSIDITLTYTPNHQ